MLQNIAFASVFAVLFMGVLGALTVTPHASSKPSTGAGAGESVQPAVPTVNLNVMLPVYLTRNERDEPEVLSGTVVVPGGELSTSYGTPRGGVVGSYAGVLQAGAQAAMTSEGQARLDIIA